MATHNIGQARVAVTQRSLCGKGMGTHTQMGDGQKMLLQSYPILHVYTEPYYIYRLNGVDVAPTEGLDHVADGAARLAGGAPLKLHTE